LSLQRNLLPVISNTYSLFPDGREFLDGFAARPPLNARNPFLPGWSSAMTELAMWQPWHDLSAVLSVGNREQTVAQQREKLAVTSTTDEVQLIEQVAGGDVRAYRQLVDRYLRGIH